MTHIPFGKYRGCALQDVDTGYLRWLLGLAGDSESSAAEFATAHKAEIRKILNAEADAMAEAAGPVNVTPHQQEAVDHLIGQIERGQPVLRLEGGAGVGKSYAVKKLLLQLREAGYQSRACATSYVATQVLAQGLEPYGFEAATVARTIKLTKVFEDGVESYELTQDSYEAMAELLSAGHVLCVDECSMISDEIGQALIDAAQNNGGRLLLVGDQYQLPPVGQDTLSVCCQTEDPATLTEPMRYARDSQLFALEQTVREDPANLFILLGVTYETNEIERVASAEALVQTYLSNFRNDPKASHRMLLFRRADVVAANNDVRLGLYGCFADDIEGGEQLMALRTSDFPYVAKAKLGDTTRYYSGESFTVADARYDTHLGIPHWSVRFDGRNEYVRVIFAISETQMDETKRGGNEYAMALRNAASVGRSTKDWEMYKRLHSDFISVAYRYATSIHRAQGQTVNYAYVMPRPLLTMKGLLGNALAYVAMTRANKKITVAA